MAEAAPAPAVDLGAGRPRRVHVVGVGGAGMSAIATVLAQMGHRVSGSDLKDSPVLDRLRAAGVDVRVGHDAANLPDGSEVVTRSTAVPDQNPEVEAARQRGLPVLRRAEMLAAIAALRPTIAVAGTHGKTTTSSMLALALLHTGRQPSFIIGGELNEIGGGAAWQADRDGWFVVEADESDGTFEELGARAAIVTSIEPDHLEHYGGFPPLVAAFDRFLAAANELRVVSVDDPRAAEAAARHGAVTYGFADGADYRLVDARPRGPGIEATVEHDGTALAELVLAVPGRHNLANATAAAVAAHHLGVPFADAAAALGRYAGVARRFEFRGEARGVAFVDDYAHLPSEVAVTVETARAGAWSRVVAVFQPHRFSRTQSLWQDFAGAFDGVDLLFVTDIYAAGEPARPGVSGRLVADAVAAAPGGPPVRYVARRGDLAREVSDALRPGDLCLTMGAGDLTSLPDDLLARRAPAGPGGGR